VFAKRRELMRGTRGGTYAAAQPPSHSASSMSKYGRTGDADSTGLKEVDGKEERGARGSLWLYW
jgi:hypothetical protein